MQIMYCNCTCKEVASAVRKEREVLQNKSLGVDPRHTCLQDPNRFDLSCRSFWLDLEPRPIIRLWWCSGSGSGFWLLSCASLSLSHPRIPGSNEAIESVIPTIRHLNYLQYITNEVQCSTLHHTLLCTALQYGTRGLPARYKTFLLCSVLFCPTPLYLHLSIFPAPAKQQQQQQTAIRLPCTIRRPQSTISVRALPDLLKIHTIFMTT